MKKLLSILALALCFVACQNEPEVNVSNSDLVDVVLNIEAPELGITRAGADGEDDSKNAKDSAYGAIDYADAAFWAQNDLRYILEVYAENDSNGSDGSIIAQERLVNCLDAYAATEFKLRLVPNRTYKFVVFADFVAQGSHQLSNPLEIADVYYNTKDLTAITSLTDGEEWKAMNEARDAYFISQNVNVTTGLTERLILTRPFAKVRVVTTDILDLEKYATPAKVVVTYYNHPIYKSFNAVNGAISEEMTGNELTHVVKYDGQYDAGYDIEDSGYMTLFADYIHATADQPSNINFRMDVFDLSGRLLKSNDFSTEIPVQRNHLTTLMGNVLTTEATVQILISDEFVGNHNETVTDREFDNDTIIVTGFEKGGTYANGAYSYKVSNATTGDSFTLNIKDSALTNGTLQKGEYKYGTHFTATNVMVNVTRAAATAEAEGGKMVVDIDENNKYTIAIDLVVKDAANNAMYPSFGYYGDFAIEAVEALAAPANFVGTVDGENVKFTWSAVEKATSYDVVFNGITATISKDTTATFTVQATDEEQKLTASIVAKADGYRTSKAATCEVVIPAKVVESEPVAIATPKVEVSVDVNVVTLTWDAVEGAAHYTVQVDDDVEVVVNATSYIFEGDYEVKYTFTVKAIAADTEKNLNSEAAVVTATTEAKPTEEVVYTSVADFLAAAEDETIYTLKGTITAVDNTTYGNFWLTDDTDSVLIYGLMSPDGATNKYWATSGAKLGDDIVVKTQRKSFNGTPQGQNATFVELLPGTRAFFTIDTAAVEFASAGGEQTIKVAAYNTDAAVSATSDNDQFTINVNGYDVTISSAANELEEEVTGNVTIKVGDLPATIVKVTLAAKPSDGAVEGGSDDFNTIASTSTSYASGKTTAGWSYVNCAILSGGTSDSNPTFKMIGETSDRALCMNGKTSAVGTITSPIINTGCGTLKFNYGLPYSDTKIKFRVDIKQNGEIVKTFTVNNSSASKLTVYTYEEAINVTGDFQIVFTNLSPSNNTGNKDRTAIWNVEWTGCN